MIVELSFKRGGFNLMPLQQRSPIAYLCSLLANKDAIVALRKAASPDIGARIEAELKHTLALIQKMFPGAKLPEFKDLSAKTRQRDLVHIVTEHKVDEIIALVPQQHQTRIRALILGMQQPGASAWKYALHTSENFMDGVDFRMAALFNVGTELFPRTTTCGLCGEERLDAFGDHALICSHKGMPTKRHNAIVRLFVSIMRPALYDATAETSIPEDKGQWRADILSLNAIPSLTRGPTAFDVTVTSNFCKTQLKKAAEEPLAAAASGDAHKRKELAGRIAKTGYALVPLGFEATGGHMPAVEQVVHYILEQQQLLTGTPFDESTSRFWQRASVEIWRFNAQALVECSRAAQPEEEDDY